MQTHDQKVYFVENITKLDNENNPQANLYQICLMHTSDKNENADRDEPDVEFEIKTYESLPRIKKKPISEGQYVYSDSNGFTNGNGEKFAKQQIFLNGINRGRLIKRNIEKKSKETPEAKTSQIVSYHVNVGHGNCSIIVLKNSLTTEIWMIDCSNKEKYNGSSYTNNIKECISYIKENYSLAEFHIDKFFLTHTHFDHYSGMLFLINNGYIDKNTECYINLHYQMASRLYNDILTRLTKMKAVIIEPIFTNSNDEVEILHPLKRTFKSNTKIPGAHFEPHVNNSSAVYLFKLGNKSILFPGDIETEGWDRLGRLQLCKPHFKKANYVCVSHHGSINGHVRTQCTTSVASCISPTTYAILMGRNGAYPGVYSSDVVNSFGSKLLFSQWSPQQVWNTQGLSSDFMEIFWSNNIFVWH